MSGRMVNFATHFEEDLVLGDDVTIFELCRSVISFRLFER